MGSNIVCVLNWHMTCNDYGYSSKEVEAITNHVAIITQGVRAWNKWRSENPDVTPDLRRADLRGACLRWADLRGADLRGAINGKYCHETGCPYWQHIIKTDRRKENAEAINDHGQLFWQAWSFIWNDNNYDIEIIEQGE